MLRADTGLAEEILVIACAAGESILQHYRRPDVEVALKGDGSPLTLADEEANALIVERLRALTPEIPIVAEESVAAGNVPAVGACFWLVDPLDGTKEFLHKNGDFTVNIALVRDGLPTLGVVHAPALGLSYLSTGSGRCAFEIDRDGARAAIRARTAPERGAVLVVSRSHRSPETAAYLAQFPDFRAAERGSSLKFCLVATGQADVYPRLGRTMEWDTAAGQAVLQAAGGAVHDVAGNVLRYGKNASFENPHFIARGLVS